MTLAWILGAAWGGMCAIPIATRARRAVLSSRVDLLRRADPSVRGRRVMGIGRARLRLPTLPAQVRALVDSILRVLRSLARRRDTTREETALARELPVVVDLLGVAVAAGCTPYLAVEVAARWGPPHAAAAFAAVLRACALGTGFAAALDDAAACAPRLRGLADALLASDRLGAPVGPQLARLADEERAALRRRAEAHARRVPVKLLFPLVFLVLPAFVLLTVVPGLVAGLQRI
jgi:tight adherence protein C